MPTSGRYQWVIPETGLSQATKGQMMPRCSKCPRETTDEFAGQHKFFSSHTSVVRQYKSRGHASRNLTAFESASLFYTSSSALLSLKCPPSLSMRTLMSLVLQRFPGPDQQLRHQARLQQQTTSSWLRMTRQSCTPWLV